MKKGSHHTETSRERMRKVKAGSQNPRYGKHHTEETKKKISQSEKGKAVSKETREKISKVASGVNNPNYGKPRSEETRRKISNANTGRKQPREAIERMRMKKIGKPLSEGHKKKIGTALRGRKLSAEHKKKVSIARRCQVLPQHHTKPELIFEAICKKNNIPFHFVGDSQLWIGEGRRKLNPDFIEANGQKICVEIFGDYWHSPLINRKMKERQTLNYRKTHYKKYKWIPIFLWESDLKRPDAEQFVLNEIQKVIEGGFDKK